MALLRSLHGWRWKTGTIYGQDGPSGRILWRWCKKRQNDNQHLAFIHLRTSFQLPIHCPLSGTVPAQALLQTSAVWQIQNRRIKYNLCSVRSFSIVYLHLSSCVLHAGKRARDRGRGGAMTERLVASLQLPADTFSSHRDLFINWCTVCTGWFYNFFFKKKKGFWLVFDLKYCSDTAAVSHKGRKAT